MAKNSFEGAVWFGRWPGQRLLPCEFDITDEDPHFIRYLFWTSPTTFAIAMRHHLTEARFEALVTYGAAMMDPKFSARPVNVEENWAPPYPKQAVATFERSRKGFSTSWLIEDWDLDDAFDVLGLLVEIAGSPESTRACRGLLAGLHLCWSRGISQRTSDAQLLNAALDQAQKVIMRGETYGSSRYGWPTL